MKRQIICVGIAALLAGCTLEDEYAMDTESKQILLVPDVSDDITDTEGTIAESARAATASLQRLAQLQFAQQPKTDDRFRQEFSIELSGLASVEYTGPFEPLIDQIARSANVKVSKIGNPTATSIIVSISAESAQLSEIMQNIAYQVQSHARISFNSNQKTIEIIYLNT